MIQPQLVPRPPVTDQGCPVGTSRTDRRALMVVFLCHASNVVVHGNDGKDRRSVRVSVLALICGPSFLLHVVQSLRVFIFTVLRVFVGSIFRVLCRLRGLALHTGGIGWLPRRSGRRSQPGVLFGGQTRFTVCGPSRFSGSLR